MNQYEFGYFPRNKYKDLVFYVKTGEHSNMGLFEMEDTEENRAIMDALLPHPYQSERDKDECKIREPGVCSIIFENNDALRTHDQGVRDKVLDELVSMLIESCSENYEPNGMGCKCCPFLIVYDDGLQCAVKELRQAGEP